MPTDESRSWKLAGIILSLVLVFGGAVVTGSIMLGEVKADVAATRRGCADNKQTDKERHGDLKARLVRMEQHIIRMETKLDSALSIIRVQGESDEEMPSNLLFDIDYNWDDELADDSRLPIGTGGASGPRFLSRREPRRRDYPR